MNTQPLLELENIERRGPPIECPVLVTERLVLRPPHAEDMDAIADLANNRHISSMLAKMPYPFTRTDAAHFVKYAGSDAMSHCVYAITLADTGEFIGACCIKGLNGSAGAEISYWLGEPYWGRGYATETLNVLVDSAFRASVLEQLFVSCPQNNVAARRVLQKCGFECVASGEKMSVAGGIFSIDHYAIEHSSWINQRSLSTHAPVRFLG